MYISGKIGAMIEPMQIGQDALVDARMFMGTDILSGVAVLLGREWIGGEPT
ncbi:MAG: hypothetical protein OET79_06080 [Nitrospirota bacterium]|nr:hypothetical protein [Nitrospirota bacterium]